MKDKINKTMVIHAIISKIKRDRNPREIRTAHVEGLKEPEKIESKYSEKSFVPDIEAVYENEHIVYEIELDKQFASEKWQTFSNYVSNYNGSFYLVVPKSLKKHVQQHLEEEEINAGVITFASKSH
jgi:hypothetical protein